MRYWWREILGWALVALGVLMFLSVRHPADALSRHLRIRPDDGRGHLRVPRRHSSAEGGCRRARLHGSGGGGE